MNPTISYSQGAQSRRESAALRAIAMRAVAQGQTDAMLRGAGTVMLACFVCAWVLL